MNSCRLSLKRTLLAANHPHHARTLAMLRHASPLPSTFTTSTKYSGNRLHTHPHSSWRRFFYASSPRLDEATAAATSETEMANDNNNNSSNEPPPIKWTTDRLTPEQIAKVDAIFHKILWLDLMETSILTECINQKLGLKLTPKQRAALQRQIEHGSGGGSQAGSKEAKIEEEDTGPKLVDLKLTGFDAKAKIKVIKEVRSIAGLGLKEAKELVEGAPTTILKELKQEQAEEIKGKLEGVGAMVEIA